MPLAVKIIFTVVLAISIMSIFLKNAVCSSSNERTSDTTKALRFVRNTILSWAWRITLIVFLWVF
jgi:hypothetical protein